MSAADIERAADLLRRGEVVGIPTETVYGLAANALNEEAVLSVFRIKKRPFFDPLILHTHSIEAARAYVKDFPESAVKLASAFWPGPLTILLPKSDVVPDIVTSGSDLVALRVPAHPLTLELLRMLDFPLAAPSANPFGYISPTRASHVRDQLGEQVAFVLDGGECSIGLESSIIDLSTDQPVIRRLGGLPLHAIESCLGYKTGTELRAGSNPAAPGMLDKHYAPSVPFILSTQIEEDLLRYRDLRVAVLGFGEMKLPDEVYTLNLSPSGNVDEAARNLFHYMRVLDRVKPEMIIAVKVPEHGLGAAINDRLGRAAFK